MGEARRKKKRELKEKQKRAEKINLKMIIPGDVGPQAAEDGFFQMSDLKDTEDLDKVIEDHEAEYVIEESEDESAPRPKHEKYSKEDKTMDSEGLWYDEHDNDSNEKIQKQNEASKNPLIMSLNNEDSEDRKARKAEMWFSKIGDIDEDS